MLSLNDSVSKIFGVGVKSAKKLEKLGIEKISDLLFYFPFRYDDFSKISKIVEVYPGERFAVKGVVKQINTIRSFRKHIFITTAIIEDITGAMKVVWFNQPYLAKALRGKEVILVGEVEQDYHGRYFSSPSYELVKSEQIHTARIVPVYSETRGISSKFLRSKIKLVIKLANKIPDFLPNNIKNNLIDLPTAIKQIHFPENKKELEKAQERLAFDELFLLQLKMLLSKLAWQKQKAPRMKFYKKEIKKFVSTLPFKLTKAQRRAAWEIICDMTSEIKNSKLKIKNVGVPINKISPMNRLLDGDVGSGKTVVAAMVMYLTFLNSYQSILMAPTEILAFQHYGNLFKLFSGWRLAVSKKIKIGLFTNSKSEINQKSINRKEMISKIKKGEIDIVIGTHALISEKISFDNLGLAIVDEQHRFGVNQRAQLRQKSHLVPHLLSMTATPIPRTLSLVIYGDVDVSILDELPPGRQKIATYLIKPAERNKAYDFINKQVQKGRQIFVICPMIEESDKFGTKSVKKEYEKLSREIFPKFKISMLHGKMKPKEKELIMTDFSAGKYNILVSTSVVEVGVDIPNATIMMIEGAERFGLAQLHQFRGRVGRGKHKSFCFLFTEIPNERIINRLKTMTQTSNGFILAQKDLETRGPGEIYGAKQSGLIDLKMAKLLDVKLLKAAKKSAQKIIMSGLDNFPKVLLKLNQFEAEKRLE